MRPIVTNPMTHFYEDANGGCVIRDELTHHVADLYNRDVHLLPHEASARAFFTERLGQLATKASYIRTHFDVPREIEEVAAALQDIAAKIGALSPRRNDAAAATIAEFEASLGTTITPAHDGPYLVTNIAALNNSKGEMLATHTEMALCRCGQSRMKPFCDGSHADARFDSGESPDRTRDRRADCVGDEVTIHDNRVTCCPSANCSDNLPSVFRVAKSRGSIRMARARSKSSTSCELVLRRPRL